jgi:hypothetical protein
MKHDKKNTRPRVLEFKTETIVQLTRDLLKDVVGGDLDSNSLHPSQCVTRAC